VPVYFNEPISMLQKVSEIMEYESLLVKASDEEESLKRLLYVAVYGVVQYKCSDKRLCKPFNPILGETFELKRPGYHFFSE
jgi:oxysterol-binding protein 1